MEEDPNLTLEGAQLALAALGALGTRAHVEALATLSAMAERATSREAGDSAWIRGPRPRAPLQLVRDWAVDERPGEDVGDGGGSCDQREKAKG
jgi:hypothetical protein